MATRRHRHRHRRADRSSADPLVVITLVDAVQLALELPGLGIVDEALVMVRHDGMVTRIIADPLHDDARLWRPAERHAERGDERILHVVVVPKVRMEPPDATAVVSFERLRRVCARLGHPMIDLIRTDGEAAQSMTIALDPDGPWPGEAPGVAA